LAKTLVVFAALRDEASPQTWHQPQAAAGQAPLTFRAAVRKQDVS
jgi:hypothetical protein